MGNLHVCWVGDRGVGGWGKVKGEKCFSYPVQWNVFVMRDRKGRDRNLRTGRLKEFHFMLKSSLFIQRCFVCFLFENSKKNKFHLNDFNVQTECVLNLYKWSWSLFGFLDFYTHSCFVSIGDEIRMGM